MFRIIKNNLISHCDQKGNQLAIYSIDFQYNGNRLATGGGDSIVRIWDINTIILPNKTIEEILLSTLSNHTKSVNVVRWSRNGNYLASGSDDCYILIYKLEKSSSFSNLQPFGSQNIHNKENWIRCLTLQGHQMDVLDLDWSQSGLLASGSIDNSVLIWDVMTNIESSQRVITALRQLNRHSSFVKGVQFDPFGIFLASSSADNTIIIWNCENWTVETTLHDPLRDSQDRSIFRRLSWTPDGGSLCVTCALKEGKPIGMVFQRDTWKSVADLVGHNTLTTCCRFNPHPIKLEVNNNDSSNNNNGNDIKSTGFTVALGDQHGVVSVWSTNENSPLFVLTNIFDGPVLDISWTITNESMMMLAVCSLDGTLAFMILSGPHTTGGIRPLSSDEFESHLKMVYGRSGKELLTTTPILLEDPSILKFRKQPSHHSTNNITNSNDSHNIHGNFDNIIEQQKQQQQVQQQQNNLKILSSIPQQTIVRTKNGKKRIQPFTTDDQLLISNKQICVNNTTIMPPPTNSILSTSTVSSVSNLLTPSMTNTSMTNTTMTNYNNNIVNSRNISKNKNNFNQLNHFESINCTLSSNNSQYHQFQNSNNITASCKVKTSNNLKNLKNNQSNIGLINLQNELNSRINYHTYILVSSDILPSKSMMNCNLSSISLKKVTQDDNVVVWETFLSGKVSCISAIEILSSSNYFTCSCACEGIGIIGTTDGCLHFLSLSTGIKIYSSLILGGSILTVDSIYLENKSIIQIFSLNSFGEIWLFSLPCVSTSVSTSDMEIKLQLITHSSLKPLLSYLGNNKEINLEYAILNEDGNIIVSTKSNMLNQRGQFQFLNDLQCWKKISQMKSFLSSDSSINNIEDMLLNPNPTTQLSDIIDTSLNIISNINSLSSSSTSIPSISISSLQSDNSFHNKLIFSQIEDNLVLYIIQSNVENARFWLSKWVLHCCKCGFESRVKLLTTQFLESICNVNNINKIQPQQQTYDWIQDYSPYFLGIEKLQILREDILPAIVTSGLCQSLVAELSDAIDLLAVQKIN